jgi:hypothetical protein
MESSGNQFLKQRIVFNYCLAKQTYFLVLQMRKVVTVKATGSPCNQEQKSKVVVHQTDQNLMRPTAGMKNPLTEVGTGACRAST